MVAKQQQQQQQQQWREKWVRKIFPNRFGVMDERSFFLTHSRTLQLAQLGRGMILSLVCPGLTWTFAYSARWIVNNMIVMRRDWCPNGQEESAGITARIAAGWIDRNKCTINIRQSKIKQSQMTVKSFRFSHNW